MAMLPAFPILAQSSSISDLATRRQCQPAGCQTSKCLRHRSSAARCIYEESLDRFRKALQLDPKYADAAHNLALALSREIEPAEALDVLEKHPSSGADHFRAKGYVLTALGRASQTPLHPCAALMS